ncbi:heat-inducible transcription repressor HrcA [Acetitomaculum ruminis DSM 5522]|uniref:Heat-inducible transcription repressor HrcA n=1 Tax=Acetitomaculum ruminis DSM 5522 TaxID=1120918 RepID=A0A1I0ZG10_9FIRM|nr:heat-inducible transcriptional repressor HrcA [Acetitomaculum ruminis]SFB24585.1 heat-inducible transcription repressor HrcA [Acetitomaculum ruminis DSM 5522]
MQQLDERKMTILTAIIKTYLESGEPVGSRTISKSSGLNLSSATIRNEMSDLEEMGYILQPHTSAGRIPSDKGYRLYVDNLMREREEEVLQMKEMVLEKASEVEETLKRAAKLLAENTNYAAMVSAPDMHGNKIKFLQLSNVDSNHVLVVVVVEGNLVKNKVIDVEEALDTETMLKLNLLLNTSLCGLSISEINLETIRNIKEQAGIHAGIVNEIIDAVSDAIAVNKDTAIYTSGATNIFKYPELSDSTKASELINAFEDKSELAALIPVENGKTGIKIYIGEESPVENMKDCSVVTATYDIGGGMQGTIGIIGPKRMDYENVVGNIKTLMNQMQNLFKDK